MDVQQLDARFDRADQAIGNLLAGIPASEPGKTALDELAEERVKLIRKAMEKVREIVAPKHGALPPPAPSPACYGRLTVRAAPSEPREELSSRG